MKLKFVFVAVAVLFALGGAWYAASPGYSMLQLRDAAVAGDEAELEDRIDFPRMRDSLKSEFKQQMATKMTSGENEGLEALGAAMAMAMVDPMIDGFVTPKTMSDMVKQGKFEKPKSGDADSPPSDADEIEWDIERDGFSRFVARPTGKDGEEGPELVFERDGLGWKLVELELPETLFNDLK